VRDEALSLLAHHREEPASEQPPVANRGRGRRAVPHRGAGPRGCLPGRGHRRAAPGRARADARGRGGGGGAGRAVRSRRARSSASRAPAHGRLLPDRSVRDRRVARRADAGRAARRADRGRLAARARDPHARADRGGARDRGRSRHRPPRRPRGPRRPDRRWEVARLRRPPGGPGLGHRADRLPDRRRRGGDAAPEQLSPALGRSDRGPTSTASPWCASS